MITKGLQVSVGLLPEVSLIIHINYTYFCPFQIGVIPVALIIAHLKTVADKLTYISLDSLGQRSLGRLKEDAISSFIGWWEVDNY